VTDKFAEIEEVLLCGWAFGQFHFVPFGDKVGSGHSAHTTIGRDWVQSALESMPQTIQEQNQKITDLEKGQKPAAPALPICIDLSSTFLYWLTGALMVVRRQYNFVGVFVLALVTSLGARWFATAYSSNPAHRPRLDKPVESAALLASISGSVFRSLAIVFNWKTMAVGDRGVPPRESSQ
jgi:hypothetical protein